MTVLDVPQLIHAALAAGAALTLALGGIGGLLYLGDRGRSW